MSNIKSEVGIFITEPGNVKRLKGIGEIVYEGNLLGIIQEKKARERIWGV